MSRSLSVYLDLLRFLAAVVVFFHHLPRVVGGYSLFEEYGEDAVMVFFVLSGFVIPYVTDAKERTPTLYAVSRLARLYSVALPALLLTLVFDEIGRAAAPELYAGWYQDNRPWLRIAASVTFTNQLWTFAFKPFGNPPWWSISYEFWYYVFFALLTFVRGRRRWWLAAWALVVGPQILLLLPVWLVGVAAYRASKTYHPSHPVAWGLALGPIALYVAYSALGLKGTLTAFSDSIIAPAFDPHLLHKGRYFLHDYALAALLAVHFLGVSALFRSREWTLGAQVIPAVAAYTFSLYLLHFPVMYALAAGWRGNPYVEPIVIGGTALVVWAVGSACESRKNALRSALLRAWAFLPPLKTGKAHAG